MPRADVFFYGLFMDEDLLRAKGLVPLGGQIAWVDGMAMRIGERAALVPSADSRVFGMLFSLTFTELDTLYADPAVRLYKPEAVLAHLASGDVLAALCYNLESPPSATERNPEYAAKLRAVAQKVGLPADYVSSIA
jgi:hypothetical protein